MNVNVEAVRDSLEERLLMGRDPMEAAGEIRWKTELERDMEILSRETCGEILDVVNEWLSEKSGDRAAGAAMAAEQYAKFLAERVKLDTLGDSFSMIENAFHEWRRTLS